MASESVSSSTRWHGSLVYLLGLCLLVNGGTEHVLSWTPEGVQKYNATNPLEVSVGDTLKLLCAEEGPLIYANVWIQKHLEQYLQCDCLAVMGQACDSQSSKNGYCVPNVVPEILVVIRQNSADLNSVVNFIPGNSFYFQSYSFNDTLLSALSEVSMGGQCSQGLKLAIHVAELPTEPPTSPSISPTRTVQIAMPDTASSVIFGPEMASMSVTISETPAVILPLKKVRDWHVAIIICLVILLFLSLLAGLLAVILVRYRRRQGTESDDKTKEKEVEVKKEVLKSGTKPEDSKMNTYVDVGLEKAPNKYPVQVFEDPLN